MRIELLKYSCFFRIHMLVFMKHMMKFNSYKSSISSFKRFETLHGGDDSFYKSMILLDHIIQIFDLANFNLLIIFKSFINIFEGCIIRATFINSNFFRPASVTNSL